jgi:hypothetical protein
MFDAMKDTTSIGVLVDPKLKKKLRVIARRENRSLSSQAELFLARCVEQWETTQNTKRGAKV